MTRLLSAAATLALMAGAATAEIAVGGAPEALAAKLQTLGYERVEIDVGPTSTKVEAVDIDGNLKVEYVFDNATGEVRDYEEETPEDDDLAPGVEIDFEDDDDSDDDEDDDQDGDDSDDDDDDDGDDDSDDDDSDDDNSDDDDEDDDSDDDDSDDESDDD